MLSFFASIPRVEALRTSTLGYEIATPTELPRVRTILSPHTTDTHTHRPTNPSYPTDNHTPRPTIASPPMDNLTPRLLNSKKYKKNYITYADIMSGGTLEFVMGK